MTISSTTNKNQYDGNGSTSVFPFTFEILEDGDLLVQTVSKTTGVITERSDYTVSTNPDRTGSITFTGTLPTTDDIVVLKRTIPQLQQTDLIENSRYSSNVVETEFDRIVILIQQLQEEVDRSLRLQEGSSAAVDINTTQVGYLYNNDGNLIFQPLVITELVYPGVYGAGGDADKPINPAVKDKYFATDTNRTYRCLVAGTWTYDESVNNLTVNGNANITGKIEANGDVITTGNVNIGGEYKLNGLNFLLDEDDMASDSPIRTASQQSIKAFVNNEVKEFGSFTSTDEVFVGGTGAAIAESTEYEAKYDGFAHISGSEDNGIAVTIQIAQTTGGPYVNYYGTTTNNLSDWFFQGATIPVAKGEFIKYIFGTVNNKVMQFRPQQ